MAARPLIGIIMGSQSDWPTLKPAADMLDALKIGHETRIVSAHRTPDRMADYAKNAAARGLKVDHRRRRRGGASARHGGQHDHASGPGRAGAEPRP